MLAVETLYLEFVHSHNVPHETTIVVPQSRCGVYNMATYLYIQQLFPENTEDCIDYLMFVDKLDG